MSRLASCGFGVETVLLWSEGPVDKGADHCFCVQLAGVHKLTNSMMMTLIMTCNINKIQLFSLVERVVFLFCLYAQFEENSADLFAVALTQEVGPKPGQLEQLVQNIVFVPAWVCACCFCELYAAAKSELGQCFTVTDLRQQPRPRCMYTDALGLAAARLTSKGC